MRKLYTTLLATVIGLTAFAQNVSVGKADQLFKERAYMDAAEMYRLISNKDQHVLQNLADSYFYTHRMMSAEGNYRELFNRFDGNIAPEYRFRYGHALRAMGKNREADEVLSEYYNQEINLRKLAQELDTIAPHTFKVRQLASNSSSSDFGITYMGDRVVFASTRNENRPLYLWNKKPYLDLYSGEMSADGEISDVQLFPGEINTDTHESSATFNADQTVMFFNRTNSERVKAEDENIRVAHISIYRAEKVNGEWTNIERVPFASDSYSTEHPALSPDGSKLYFASDMPGSLGSFDIYVVDINADGSYGEPRNLGPAINSEHREQFPFISSEDVLYYSSNGKTGFGNLDIFRAELKNGSFEEAQNLGGTVNSGSDDFAFVIKPGEDKGHFTSVNNGTENLYSFVREENKRPEPVVAVELTEENEVTGAQQLRDVSNIYFDFDKSEILPQAEVVLDRVVKIMKDYPRLELEIGSHSDARGSDKYNMDLSERRAAATLEYIVSQGIDRSRLSSKGYGESMPLNDCTEPDMCTEEQYAKNRRSEFKVMN
ncbi:peptidoglycan-associated lipoprotein [Salinimicrobium catena]|uniref:Peptidoglycan-associated lipoprotein n=1 Tax=Salinimicrobium catena TaxID=390640 RepID=A0A1H5NJA9_9FLAO|nr:OmpA family protein [Salinimicrobium catena]SDL47895.1 peptidoglycan-associated lipoprotein [Salinimicrobium catena]SEF01534.1 peptidoglycan-associated lipoprotein [Salinimicrobium catena]